MLTMSCWMNIETFPATMNDLSSVYDECSRLDRSCV